MSAILIARNPALQRLQDEGYVLRVEAAPNGTFLFIEQVPYVNSKAKVRRGTLVTKLELSGDLVAAPVVDHQMWIIGEHPCDHRGQILEKIRHSDCTDFGDGLVVDHGFSAKLHGGQQYPDYYVKITQYVTILQSPAQQLEPGITARVHQPFVPDETLASVFRYPDTATSRNGTGVASSRLAKQRVAIIGVGGTGGYVLDFVAKTHAAEIHLFDGDVFENHSAFRAPGAASREELEKRPSKVEYFANLYSRMRHKVQPHPYYITLENVGELDEFDFVFVCVDSPAAREVILKPLLAKGVPFADTGMSIQKAPDGSLMGQVRTTVATPERNDHLGRYVSFADGGDVNDVYAADIQVAEMNALNALMAVVAWKKRCGYFLDQMGEHHSVYTIGTHSLVRAEEKT